MRHELEGARLYGIDGRLLRIGLLAVLTGIVGIYLVQAGLHSEVDFGVYRAGAHALLTGRDLYRLRVPPQGLPFTYPPAAAALFVPLTWLPVRAGQIVWMAVTLAGLCAFVRMTVNRYANGLGASDGSALLVVLILVAYSDPVSVGQGLGQVNAIIGLLLVADLCGVLSRVPRGIMIGVAAALKLTPLFLVAYFVAVRRYRAAAVSVFTFAAVSASGFLLAPHASTEYWLHGYFADARRTGGVSYISNQSLYGVIVRLTGGPSHVGLIWASVAVSVAGVVLWAARRLHEQRPWLAEAIALAAMLLLSPVSWVHHWVLVLPFLASCFRLRAEGARQTFLLWSTLALSAVLVLRVVWWVPHDHNVEYSADAWQFVVGNSDVLLLLISIAAVLTATIWRRKSDSSLGAPTAIRTTP